MRSLFPFVLLLCALGGLQPLLASAPPDGSAAEIRPATMTPAEISAHNKALDQKHPDYIRCQRAEATGSLIGTKRTCRTNARWDAVAPRGKR